MNIKKVNEDVDTLTHFHFWDLTFHRYDPRPTVKDHYKSLASSNGNIIHRPRKRKSKKKKY